MDGTLSERRRETGTRGDEERPTTGEDTSRQSKRQRRPRKSHQHRRRHVASINPKRRTTPTGMTDGLHNEKANPTLDDGPPADRQHPRGDPRHYQQDHPDSDNSTSNDKRGRTSRDTDHRRPAATSRDQTDSLEATRRLRTTTNIEDEPTRAQRRGGPPRRHDTRRRTAAAGRQQKVGARSQCESAGWGAVDDIENRGRDVSGVVWVGGETRP